MYGVALTRVTLAKINNSLIPLPPFHEQNQIVSKLDELLSFCDDLEESIKESQGLNEILLQEVLREALQGEEVNA
jgi:type I restriction enzyme S subunit